jgi:penicillin-binding protein 2
VASPDTFQQDKRSRRAWRISTLVAAGSFVLAARLFDLQVLGGQDYQLQSERNRVRQEFLGAPRGLIIDRRGVVLADSRPSFTVLGVPRMLLKNPASLGLLSELMEVPEAEITERLRSGPRELPRVVRRDVGFPQVSRIAERAEELPGVSLQVTNVRHYPQGSLAAHLLGHVGEISENEVELLREQGYRPGDFVGRTGIEKVYESDLRGRDGERFLEVDAVGRVIGPFHGRDPIPPVTGHTLRLHLDARIQALAESLLVGRRGAACVLDVATGGVLALASAPTFDSNLFATGIATEQWERLNTDPQVPLLNRAVQAVYAPGSTFKIVSFSLALDDRVVSLRGRQSTPCWGGYQFGNRYFRCWEEHGHGYLDLEGGLVQSCDVYFYQIGEQLDVDHLARYAREAGLGEPTGIDLPQELTGNVPGSEWLDRRYGKGRWSRGTLLNLVIGQGENLVTPLQLARLACAIARSGEFAAPRLAAAVDADDGTRLRFPPVVQRKWNVTPQTTERLREAMRRVVADSTGTGRGCRVPGWTVAAKTGTAENPHGKPHSWFMGYAPTERPEVAFSVVVEAGGHGSDVALPIARTILRAIAPEPPPKESPPKELAPKEPTS